MNQTDVQWYIFRRFSKFQLDILVIINIFFILSVRVLSISLIQL